MKLILTRHGETEENKSGIVQGHIPGKLSAMGIEQAKKVALRLKDEHIDLIYSSDLARASDTAKEIAKYHPNVPIKFVTDLREKYLGDWQGKTLKELGFSSSKDLLTNIPKNGETTEEMFDRARNFLHKIISKHQNKVILFVGHLGINKAILTAIIGKDAKHIPTLESTHNANISIFEIEEDGKHKIHVFNCIEHLNKVESPEKHAL